MRSLWTGLRVSFGTLLLAANTVLHVPFLMSAALLKVVMPWRGARRVWNRVLMAIAASWIGVNTALIRLLHAHAFRRRSMPALRPQGHYLVLANHQTWVDIPVLQAAFNRRMPLLRFFLKSQLFWVPLLGLAWWALDFPFMKRYSRQQLEQASGAGGARHRGDAARLRQVHATSRCR